MLKMVLQPLVENAFVHGMANIADAEIKITGRLEDNCNIVFCVEDNGAGIPQEKLDGIRKSLVTSSAETNMTGSGDFYALRNINRRIKLHYGDLYGIQIDSEYGTGTRVTIKLPAELSRGVIRYDKTNDS
ncbi:MAG: hypothetical protein GX115_03470 [Ruminiclostridium sp.]|nr:hypothetical protein [Ruminiclostridium sp.]